MCSYLQGLPPHGRGKVTPCIFWLWGSRITPAWAGKSRLRKMYRPAFTGSPPHRRGKARVQRQDGPGVGITPAQAGKRHTGRRCRGLGWDHPRAGGEKVYRPTADPNNRGSPPHGRGKAERAAGRHRPAGITPAWAGKSGRSCGQTSASRDHPRVGGEKGFPTFWSRKNSGSPPHWRGKVIKKPQGLGRKRITPAWAGKSPASQPWSPPL